MLARRAQTNVLPILMGMTTPTPIREDDGSKIIYDEKRQITYETMGILGWLNKTHQSVGTKCLRTGGTMKKGNVMVSHDQKNEIDDSKGKEDKAL